MHDNVCSRLQLRLISLNLRDYPGSTPYSDAKLNALKGLNAGIQTAAIAIHGLELTEFLIHVAKNLCIPKISSSNEKLIGGVSVLTWSLGGMAALSLLSHVDKIEDGRHRFLDECLRSVVLYGEYLCGEYLIMRLP